MTGDDDRDRTLPEVAPDHEPIDLSDIRPDDYLVFAVFWALAGVVFLQFFTRYVLNDSLGWTEEVARFLLIAVTFVGAIMAVRKRSHIAVEVLYIWIPARLSHALHLIVDAVALVFYLALGWYTIELAQRTFQKMVSIDVPKSWVYWGVAACFGAMALYAAMLLARRALGRPVPSAGAAGAD